MTITHVITSISRQGGGTSTYLRDLLNALLGEATNNLVCCFSKDSIDIDKNTIVKTIDSSGKFDKPNYKEFKNTFRTLNSNLYHGHGLWDFPTHAMAKYARKNNIPYVMSPHGMLEPWSLTQSKFKKKIALGLFQHKDLNLASCIHATAKAEANNIRDLGYKNPIAVIPNGINLVEFPDYQKEATTKRKVLFLSRIHPKKGIELLIQAWSGLDIAIIKDWEVEIVGNGDGSYIEGLKSLIIALKLEHVIMISEPVFGLEKQKKYQSASLFVLPTYSENFGIVVAEALASKIPVITTVGTPWEELKIYNCGQWIEIGKDPLKASLQIMLSKSRAELQEMGDKGRKLIEEKYSMEAVAKQMLELYQWILTKENKPEFVETL